MLRGSSSVVNYMLNAKRKCYLSFWPASDSNLKSSQMHIKCCWSNCTKRNRCTVQLIQTLCYVKIPVGCQGYHLIKCVHVQLLFLRDQTKAILRRCTTTPDCKGPFILCSDFTVHTHVVGVCCYLGERPPVHVSAPDVNVRPIHYPEWGM